jgi:hypothetical protein
MGYTTLLEVIPNHQALRLNLAIKDRCLVVCGGLLCLFCAASLIWHPKYLGQSVNLKALLVSR